MFSFSNVKNIFNEEENIIVEENDQKTLSSSFSRSSSQQSTQIFKQPQIMISGVERWKDSGKLTTKLGLLQEEQKRVSAPQTTQLPLTRRQTTIQ